jgi:hypothetical protein
MNESFPIAASRPRIWPYLVAFALCVLLVFTRYFSYLALPFAGDDMAFLTEPLKRNIMSAVPKRGLPDFLEVWSPNHGWFYRPTYLTYWMVMHKLGLTRPDIMHGVGLLLHAVNIFLWGVLAFRVSHRVLIGVAAAAGAFFWPGGEEAFRWIAANSTLFAVLGALGAANCWVSWRQNRGKFWYFAGLLSFWLGCSAKNDAAIGIVLFPLLDQFFDVGSGRQRIKAYAPYFGALLLYLIFEWHGARLYGAHSDGVYKVISEVPLASRPHYIFSWFYAFTGRVIPVYPLSFNVLFCVPLALTFWRVMAPFQRSVDTRLTHTFYVAAGLAGAASLAPFVSTFQAMQSRLLYFPAFPFSLALIFIAAASFWAALQMKSINSESELSSSGVALAICAISVLYQPDFKASDSAVESIIWIFVLTALGLCWRAGLLDLRVAASLGLAIIFREVQVYAPTQSLSGWLFVACGVSAFFWRRNWAVGTVLTYASWLNPVVTLLFLIGRALCYRFSPRALKMPIPMQNQRLEQPLS